MEKVEEKGFEPRLSSKNPPCRSAGTMLELRRTDTELDQAPGAVGGRTGHCALGALGAAASARSGSVRLLTAVEM